MLTFNMHKEIKATRDSEATCKAGHAVKAGESIGYARRGAQSSIVCAACWARWSGENAEARMMEG